MGAESMVALRRIALYLNETGHIDREWFATAIEEYASRAALGATLDDALSLARGPGERGWWEIESRDARDALIRSTVAAHFAGLSAAAAARGLLQALARYEAGVWRTQRAFRTSPDAAESLSAALFAILKTGAPVSARTVRRVLATVGGYSWPTVCASLASPDTEDPHGPEGSDETTVARSARDDTSED
jgi:hypothetical protein